MRIGDDTRHVPSLAGTHGCDDDACCGRDALDAAYGCARRLTAALLMRDAASRSVRPLAAALRLRNPEY